MKLTTFVLLVFFMQVSAATKAQLTLRYSGGNLRTVLKDLSRQSGYDFIYADKDVNTAVPVNVNISNVGIETALAACFNNQPLTYVINDKTVVVKKRENPGISDRIIKYFTSINVSGRVEDADTGQPLAGATVTVKGTSRGTITNDK